jgi:hypothetical protein
MVLLSGTADFQTVLVKNCLNHFSVVSVKRRLAASGFFNGEVVGGFLKREFNGIIPVEPIPVGPEVIVVIA